MRPHAAVLASSLVAVTACAQLAGLGDYGRATAGGGGAEPGTGGTDGAPTGSGGAPQGGGDPGAGGSNTGGSPPASCGPVSIRGRTPYESAVLDGNPCGYWRLNETSGDVASPLWGTMEGSYLGDPPTLGVPGLLKSEMDAAVAFTVGTSEDYSRLQLGPVVDFTQPFTVELWIDPGASMGAGSVARTSGGEASTGFELAVDATGATATISFQMYEGVDAAGPIVTIPVDDVSVTHLVAAFNGTRLTLYVDGVAYSSELAPDFEPTPGTGPLEIGRGFDGILDELAIYDHALSENDAAGHYAVGTSNP